MPPRYGRVIPEVSEDAQSGLPGWRVEVFTCWTLPNRRSSLNLRR